MGRERTVILHTVNNWYDMVELAQGVDFRYPPPSKLKGVKHWFLGRIKKLKDPATGE